MSVVATSLIKKLTAECGILELLESGVAIMADRGFTIEDFTCWHDTERTT